MPTIDNLPAAASLTGTEEVPLTQGTSEAKKTTAQDIANLAPSGPTLPVSIADGGSGQITAQAALDAFFASVTKGNLWGGDGTHISPLAVGTNGQVLTVKSSQPLGFHWETPTATGVTTVNGAAGAITVQGTTGRVLVGAVGAVTTITLPATLDYTAAGVQIDGPGGSNIDINGAGNIALYPSSGNGIQLQANDFASAISLADGGHVNITAPTLIGLTGPIGTDQTAAATIPGTVIAKMPIFDAGGTLIGYLPIFDTIT